MTTIGFRTCAVFDQRGRVLLHQGDGDDFWGLPGGHVSVGEHSRDALAREIEEELGVAAEVLELLWVVENLFAYRGSACHEIGFYYRTSARNVPTEAEFRGREAHLLFRWFELEGLAAVDVRPKFLREKLARIGPGIEHLEWRDGA
jgi:8-oxo-dGTP pyrophosphatase MutT (NUDIX family)